jgi:hypothetical protein
MAAEKQFEEKLKKWLESEGIYALGTPEQDMAAPPCGYWEKRWGGGKYIKAGMPDMHIVVYGISIEVELKAPNGKPSALQIQKLNQIDSAGCIGLVLFPADFPKFQRLVLFIKQYAADTMIRFTHALGTSCGLEGGWKNAAD